MQTFSRYTDAALTVEFDPGSGAELSPTESTQDYVLYLGSTNATRQIKASSNPGVDQIAVTPIDVMPVRANSTAYVAGNTYRDSGDNGYRYECKTAGTSAASAPTLPTTLGEQVTDGTAVFECMGLRHKIAEVKLALTSGDLGSATGGAALNLGTAVLGGAANAVAIHIRLEDATSGSPGIDSGVAFSINALLETSV